MNVVLVGLMGSGKSSVGRILAKTLGRPFVDTDQVVIAAAGHPIPEIFAAEGEAGFRAREARAVAEAAARDGQVIATGGGAVLAEANREALRRTGLVIWLAAPAEELLRRALLQGVAKRPLLAGEDPLGKMQALMAEREPAYRAAAHHRIETGGLTTEQVAARIGALLKGANGDVAGGSESGRTEL